MGSLGVLMETGFGEGTRFVTTPAQPVTSEPAQKNDSFKNRTSLVHMHTYIMYTKTFILDVINCD